MLKNVEQKQHLFYIENNYKYVTENVGCKVSHHMTDPQPTDKGSDTESKKPSENLSQPWELIKDVVNNCSEQTQEEFREQLREKLDDVVGETE